MIPVMIVPVLTEPALLYRMLQSVDHPIQHIVIIDNGGVVNEHLTGTGRVSVIRMPANLGVAGSWNLGIKATPFAPWWLIVNFDVLWLPGSLASFADTSRTDALTLSGGEPPWCAFALGEDVVNRVGLFDEKLHPAYFEDNDYERRCQSAGIPVVNSGIPLLHRNSSTLAAGFHQRNSHTFQGNADYYRRKVLREDMTEGGWSLEIRRNHSWDSGESLRSFRLDPT